MKSIARQLVIGACAIAVCLLAAPVASATPTTGVEATTLAETTVAGTHYILRELTLQPGATTGWHYHDGPLYAVVRNGILSHYDSSCTVDGTHGPGHTIIEPSGPGYIHIGRNQGSQPVVLDVLYTLPVGAPPSRDVPNPGCSFQ
ncbi:cupin [Nocardia sp. NPDC046473]|uniref:cupin n=1 Tax=Nocardia sp. NPDC046473 TaxID=3155733 RepID=UPI00340D1AB5